VAAAQQLKHQYQQQHISNMGATEPVEYHGSGSGSGGQWWQQQAAAAAVCATAAKDLSENTQQLA
jgi:hypothetical protein